MYHTLPENEIHDYQALRKALHVRFRILAKKNQNLFKEAQGRNVTSAISIMLRCVIYFRNGFMKAEIEKRYARRRELCIKETVMER